MHVRCSNSGRLHLQLSEVSLNVYAVLPINNMMSDTGLAHLGTAMSLGAPRVLRVADDSGLAEDERKKIRGAAEDFEALFLRLLFKQMRATITKGGLFGNDFASGIFEDMFYEEAANVLSKAKPGTGLSDIVYDDIIRLEKREGLVPVAEAVDVLRSQNYLDQVSQAAGNLNVAG